MTEAAPAPLLATVVPWSHTRVTTVPKEAMAAMSMHLGVEDTWVAVHLIKR